MILYIQADTRPRETAAVPFLGAAPHAIAGDGGGGAGRSMKEYAKKFYLSAAWRRTRDAYARYRCGICERCGAAGDIVHHKTHITPANIRDPRVTLNFANLELLCQDCHNKEHFKRVPSTRYRIGSDGSVLPPEGGENEAAADTGGGR